MDKKDLKDEKLLYNVRETVIAISHDREFLKDTGIEREILLE